MFEQAFKNIDDVLRKEAGCTTESSPLDIYQPNEAGAPLIHAPESVKCSLKMPTATLSTGRDDDD